MDMYWFGNIKNNYLGVIYCSLEVHTYSNNFNKGNYGFEIYSAREGAKTYKLYDNLELNNTTIDIISSDFFNKFIFE